jgi:hypothetical protein
LDVDVSQMTKEWWSRNVTGSLSDLHVVCRTCTARINSIQQGHNFGCFCNGGVPWCSEIGRARCLALIEDRGLNVDTSSMTKEWWAANVEGNQSNLLVICRDCGYTCTSRIASIQQGHNFGCFCNGGMLWNGQAGRVRCLALIEERGLNVDALQMTRSMNVRSRKVRPERSAQTGAFSPSPGDQIRSIENPFLQSSERLLRVSSLLLAGPSIPLYT